MPVPHSQHQQDAILMRRALKFALAHRRDPVGMTSLWRDEQGKLVDPPLEVGALIAIVEREVYLEAEHAG